MTTSIHAEGRSRLRKILQVSLLAVSLAWPLAAQAEVVAFHADFDLDTVGEAPSADPPGEPDGDHLGVDESGGSIRVQESFGDLLDQPLLATRSETGALVRLSAVLDPDLQECSSYKVSWRSLVDRFVGYFYVAFYAPNRNLIAAVEYRGAGVHSVNSDLHPLSVEYVPNVAELFELDLDFEAKTLRLSIDGVAMTEVEDMAFINTLADGLWYFTTSFGLTDLYSVAMDDLHVEASGCSNVAGEETSWGAIKGMY